MTTEKLKGLVLINMTNESQNSHTRNSSSFSQKISRRHQLLGKIIIKKYQNLICCIVDLHFKLYHVNNQ